MKVLIVGLPRSGTTSLQNSFSDQGYTKINEPYNYALDISNQKLVNKTINYDYPPKEVIEEDNVIVKTIVGHIADIWEHDWYSFIIEFSKHFDKVILLDRLQFEEHLMSVVHLKYKLSKGESVRQKWIRDDINDDFLAGYMAAGGDELLKNDKAQLKRISDKLNIPITYYENLYSDDRIAVFELINKWNLDIDPFDMLDYLDPSKKLKQNDKKSVI